MATHDDVIRTLMAMGQIYGKQINEDAAKLFIDDLADLNADAVLNALRGCRRELNRFPTLADIVARVEQLDGRPGPEEAWAMLPKDEYSSVVWSDEMRKAYAAAGPLIREGDTVAARMAFKERYLQEVQRARADKIPPNWTPSFGYEPSGRVAAVREAMDRGRITDRQAAALLPDFSQQTDRLVALEDMSERDATPAEETKARIHELISSISKKMPAEPEETK
jgi:hypothetical protein